MANKFGASGIPTGGYPSQRQFRAAMRMERIKDVMARVEMIKAGEKRMEDHFMSWVNARCHLDLKVGSVRLQVECSVKILRQSYLDWCEEVKSRPAPAQTWGRWMSAHWLRESRNSQGKGRVYCGVAVTHPSTSPPVASIPVPEETPEETPAEIDIDPWTGKPL